MIFFSVKITNKASNYYLGNINQVIIKPTDMGGGKGIAIAEDIDTFREAISLARKVSKSRNIIIEDYVEGQLHSLTTYIKNQKIIFYHSILMTFRKTSPFYF